nr:immunoglobulin heavy chain junction region [Macaca mulatta]MOV36839.1 immunoglobulin heavy chain junction region [Macaca mulatta]
CARERDILVLLAISTRREYYFDYW